MCWRDPAKSFVVILGAVCCGNLVLFTGDTAAGDVATQENPILVTPQSVRKLVQAPDEFEVALYATSADVGYPFAISTALSGEVFIASEFPSDDDSAGGRILRCIDTNDDGRLDLVHIFAKVDRPRGLVFQDGSAWVIHPPMLSAFHDDDRDGTADRSEVLVTGLGSERRDDDSLGMRMGIDGWIYLTLGGHATRDAMGTDGRTVRLRGGEIVRVRPDGKELEIFAAGLRQPSDVTIDPYLNVFADGGKGLRHLFQMALPAGLHNDRPDEGVVAVSTAMCKGGPSLFCEGLAWPDRFQGTLLSSDRSVGEISRNIATPVSASFDLAREAFLKFPNPAAMDMDACGYLYVASRSDTPDATAFVARIAPYSQTRRSVPNLREADILTLMKHLTQGNAAIRLATQRELLRRGPDLETSVLLLQATANKELPLVGRVAAIYALKQLDGEFSHLVLFRLLADDDVREFALRALADRTGQVFRLDPGVLERSLGDRSPRVRAAALIGLTRLNSRRSAWRILPLTNRVSGFASRPEADRVIPRLAVQALVSLNAVDECLAALDGPYRPGALRALARMYDRRNVEGLIRKVKTVPREQRRQLVTTLIRLYYQEVGTILDAQPGDSQVPRDRRPWPMSEQIAAALRETVKGADKETIEFVQRELNRRQVYISGLSMPATEN